MCPPLPPQIGFVSGVGWARFWRQRDETSPVKPSRVKQFFIPEKENLGVTHIENKVEKKGGKSYHNTGKYTTDSLH